MELNKKANSSRDWRFHSRGRGSHCQMSLDPGNFAQKPAGILRHPPKSPDLGSPARKSAGTLRHSAYGDMNPSALVTISPTAMVKNGLCTTDPARQNHIATNHTISQSAPAPRLLWQLGTRRGRKTKRSARDHEWTKSDQQFTRKTPTNNVQQLTRAEIERERYSENLGG